LVPSGRLLRVSHLSLFGNCIIDRFVTSDLAFDFL